MPDSPEVDIEKLLAERQKEKMESNFQKVAEKLDRFEGGEQIQEGEQEEVDDQQDALEEDEEEEELDDEDEDLEALRSGLAPERYMPMAPPVTEAEGRRIGRGTGAGALQARFPLTNGPLPMMAPTGPAAGFSAASAFAAGFSAPAVAPAATSVAFVSSGMPAKPTAKAKAAMPVAPARAGGALPRQDAPASSSSAHYDAGPPPGLYRPDVHYAQAPLGPPLPMASLVRQLAGHGLVFRCGAVVPFPIRSARVFPGGNRVITAGEDGTARIWDARSGEQLIILNCHRAGVLGTVVFEDGHRVLTTGADGTACVWDVDRGSKGVQLARLEGHSTPVTGGAVYPNGERVITMGLDGSGRIWDVRAQRIIAPLAGVGKTVVAIFPDGDHVAVASEKGQAEVWYGRTGELVTEIGGHRGAITAMCIFPGGGRILTIGEDGTSMVWDAKRGKELARLEPHVDALLCVSVSSCGSRILTGGRDGTARVSSTVDGRTLASWGADGRPPGGEGAEADRSIHACAFFPDGERVLIAGAAGARIWRLPEAARAVDTGL